MKKIVIVNILLFFTLQLLAQSSFTVNTIQLIDEISGVPISNANVEIKELNKKIKTNNSGQIKTALPLHKTYRIVASHPAYFSKIVVLNTQNDSTYTIKLAPALQSVIIGEVEKVALRNKKFEILSSSVESLTPKQIEKIPSIGGEKDILRSLTLLPGFNSSSEGTAQLSVRSGTPGQNLYLLDGYTLYKSSHLLGLLSVYNNQIISGFEAYKSSFPSKFGSRTASIIDVRTSDPDLYKFQGNAEIGLLTSKATAQLPIIKGKMSLFVSGRVSYIDKLARLFQNKNNIVTFNYYDIFGKVVYKLNKNNTLKVDFFIDNDKYLDEYISFNKVELTTQYWKNIFGGIQFISSWGENNRNQINIGRTNYSNGNISLIDNSKTTGRIEKYSFQSTITDNFIRDNAEFSLNEKCKILVGGEFINHKLKPTLTNYYYDSILIVNDGSTYSLNELNLYSDISFVLSSTTEAKIGLRSSNYLQIKSFIEPRLVIKHKPTSQNAIIFSFSRISQPLHLLSNSGLGFSSDIWFSSNEQLTPTISDQLSFCFLQDIIVNSKTINLSVETFFKMGSNETEFLDGFSTDYFSAYDEFSKKKNEPYLVLSQGSSKSYGIEVLLEKKEGKLSGWLSYALSKSTSQFDQLNCTKPFPSKFDRRHSLSIHAIYILTPIISMSIDWNYGSGYPLTLANYVYYHRGLEFGTGNFYSNTGYSAIPVTDERNNYRMKSSHTLNISGSRKIKLFKLNGCFELGIYNVYNRKNPSYYTYNFELKKTSDGLSHNNGKPVVELVSLLPIIPYFNIKIDF